MYNIEYTYQFKKDYKKMLSRNLSELEINKIITALISKKELPAKYKSHPLKGNYNECMECHIKPDWLLIWKTNKETNTLTLIRTGSHSDLF